MKKKQLYKDLKQNLEGSRENKIKKMQGFSISIWLVLVDVQKHLLDQKIRMPQLWKKNKNPWPAHPHFRY